MLTENINEKKRIFLQRKLSYYLRRYRIKHNLSSKENSLRMGYVPARYCALESETKPYPRLISVYEFLVKLASLEDLTVAEFIRYLDGEPHSSIKQNTNWREPLIEVAEAMTYGEKELLREQLVNLDRNTLNIFHSCMELFIYSKLHNVPQEFLLQLTSLIRRGR